ncbi:hypothetical protein A3844_28695 [Paenibacillus helianthi]|uniref:Nodulation protein n=1 Tax=Paenibacillus helianthi TaxID=1349432 RepID=A0ABX3EHE4_9BACL|nr:carbamoyltransferase C-terminal domain-containing protein [Paenibacillus helianthi]OKP79508.1 hypothetical protein A3844_28695 [Paenibacillus helianthi]
MLILGISGGIDSIHDTIIEFPYGKAHDSAAVLIEDGHVVAAIEEERLNRIKHTNRLPIAAIEFCLTERQVTLQDIDYIAVYGTEHYIDQLLKLHTWNHPDKPLIHSVRNYMASKLQKYLGSEFSAEKIIFVPHHICHTMSAYYASGYDESLIMSLDGTGDGLSGLIQSTVDGQTINTLHTIPEDNSLGLFYLEVIKFLGYQLFDEYKVMGLAPYGDASVYRSVFRKFYTLHPDGTYTLHTKRIGLLYEYLTPRRKGETFTQVHQNISASLQEMLETIVLHMLTFFKKETSIRKLCMAGGVAHNCSMNGKIYYSGLFDEIFVQPAAHDAGCSLGAALHVYYTNKPERKREQITDVYWGTDLPPDESVERELAKWNGLVEFAQVDNITEAAAEMLAEGKVIGWVQGRSEFGPRALGNRSIIADPRPSENKTIINSMVKKREGYRPFAPAVLASEAPTYFDVIDGRSSLDYMVFVLNVKEQWRSELGAITHVDGTARVQTVRKDTNPLFYQLIRNFQQRTGIPIVLNTSFNNNAEPIVNSVHDALACYLTTELNGLCIGNYVIRKKAAEYQDWASYEAVLMPYAEIVCSGTHHTGGIGYGIRHRYSGSESAITEELYEAVVKNTDLSELSAPVIESLTELWTNRLISIQPKR